MDIVLKIDDKLWADLALYHAAHKSRCQSLTCPLRNSTTPEDYVRWAVELFIREEKPQWDMLHQTPRDSGSNPSDSSPIVTPQVMKFEEFMRMLFGPGTAGKDGDGDGGEHR